MGNSGSIVKCDYLADRLVFEKSSYFQSQIQLQPVECGQLLGHSLNEFVDLIPKCDAVEQTFDMEKLPYSVARRFTELLPSATVYFFSTTSPHNYRQCLDIRGLEYSSFHVDSYTVCSHMDNTNFCGLTGRRETQTCIHNATDKWTNFRVIRDVLDCGLYSKSVDIAVLPATYKQLRLTFDKNTFNHNYAEAAVKLIHPNLDVLRVIFRDCEEINQSPMLFQNFVRFLESCTHVRKMRIDFGACTFAEDPAFASIRSAIEYWASRSPQLELFLLSYNKSEYKLDQGQLKVVLKLGNEWFMCSGYNDARIAALVSDNHTENYSFPFWASYWPISTEKILEYQRRSQRNDSVTIKNNFRILSK